MKTDNELIAKFMGEKYHSEYGHYQDKYIGEAIEDKFGDVMKPEYATSWDWLMPVVEKINREYLSILDATTDVNSHNTVMILIQRVRSCSITAGIDTVYKIVVEFIKWYNSQPKPQ